MADDTTIRVLTVDDHPLVREGIAMMIQAQSDMVLVGQAVDGRDAVRAFREGKPDVTLLDLRLPDMSGTDVLAALRREFPNARVIMLTTFEGDVEVRRALDLGARGFLLKTMTPAQIVEAIRQVHGGRRCVPADVASHLIEYVNDDMLTAREVEILELIAAGNRNRDIGEALSIREDTVKVHVKHIMEKLGASDRTESVVIALRRGIIHM